MTSRKLLLLAVLVALGTLGAGGAGAGGARAATVWAVGDGAVPGPEDDAVARRIAREGVDRLLYLGDVYETGTAQEFADNYHTSFGRFRAITSPTPGNHEWGNRATGYDAYWGPHFRQPDGGHYYSFDVAGWHMVSLNSEEPIGPGSAQLAWLERDLASRPGSCTVAFAHRPRRGASVGRGDDWSLEPAWAALQGRAAALFSGHDHNYQRFWPDRGIVQFVVGTGGRFRYPVNRADRRLASADDDHFGALRLHLVSGRADFAFVTTRGRKLDSGSLACAPSGPGNELAIVAPRGDRTHSRRLRRIYGISERAAGPVRVSLVRRTGRGCRVLSGRRFSAAPCSTRRSVRASGRSRWSHRIARRLPRGSYTLTARVPVGDGRVATDQVRFRVR